MRIYDKSLDLAESVCELSRKVQQHDSDLARQMRKSSTSVPLNIAEGMYSRAGTRIARYENAMASAKETQAALDVSVRAQYLPAATVVVDLDRIDHIVATLWKWTRQQAR
jgi:four helix bundle protein